MQEMNDEAKKAKRWSARQKVEVVQRLFRGELIDDVSRDVGVETYKLDEWYRTALEGVESSFKQRAGSIENKELMRAKQRIGELSMENELLKMKAERSSPLALRRLKK